MVDADDIIVAVNVLVRDNMSSLSPSVGEPGDICRTGERGAVDNVFKCAGTSCIDTTSGTAASELSSMSV
jgi:hypothetical protein